MNQLEFVQMEELEGGISFGCAVALTSLGFAWAAALTATAVTAGGAVIVIGGLYASTLGLVSCAQ
jgi:hypothetical protein